MKKQANKIIAIICTVALLLSVVNVGLFITASSVVQTATSGFTSDDNGSYTSVYGKNLLANTTLTANVVDGTDAGNAFKLSSNKKTYLEPDHSILTDGSNANYNHIQTNKVIGAKGDYEQKDEYVELLFTAGNALNGLEKMLIVWGLPTVPKNRASMHYDIFMGSDTNTLYTTPLASYKASTRNINEHALDLTSVNLTNIKYIAIRIYEMPLANGACAQLSEIALYGKDDPLTTGDFTADADGSYASVYGANLLANTTLTADIVDGSNKENDFKPRSGNKKYEPIHSILTDGSNGAVNQIQTNEVIGAKGDYEQKDEYVELLFTAKSPLNALEKMLIAWDIPANISTTGTDRTSKHYEVFMGDDTNTLYNEAVFSYQSSERQGNEHILDLTGKNLANVKYIAIRIYEMSIRGTTITPSEIAVYGSGIAPEIINSHKSATFTNQYGANRLAESTISGFETNDKGTTKQDIKKITSKLIDGNCANNQVGYDVANPETSLLNAQNNGIEQTDAYFQIDFAINGVVNNPEKFFIAFHEGSNKSLSSQHYAFYISSDSATLYDDANKVYEYKSSTGDGEGVEHLYDISGKKFTNVKFVGLRIYHRAYKECAQHLAEVGLYGGEFTVDTSKVHQVKSYHDDLAQHGQNYLRWDALSSIATNGTTSVEVSIKNSNLTDSTINQYIFTTDTSVLTEENNGIDQKTAYIQLTFDLFGVLNNPNKFIIDFHEGTNANLSSCHYEIFASDKQENLYDDSSKLWEYKSSTGEGVQHQISLDHLGLTGLTYFGVRIYNRGYNNYAQHIADIGLYGDEDTKFVADMAKLALQVEGTHKYPGWVDVYGTNYFATAEGSIIATNGSATSEFYYPVILTEDRFTENNFIAENILNQSNNWSPENPQKTAYIQITEKLSGVITNPERVSISFHEGNKTDRASRCYEVFASQTEEDLFKPESSVYYYEGAAKGVEHHINISGMNLENIRYFGIRFYHRYEKFTNKEGGGLPITEIGLFGGEFTKDSVIESIETSGTVEGENLAPYADVYATASNKGEFIPEAAANLDAVVDNDEETSAIIHDKDMPQDDATLGNGTTGKESHYALDFYLRYNTNIDTIRIVNADKEADSMYRYEFYLSEDIANLYDKENLLFQGHEGDGIVKGEYINSNKDKVQIFNFKENKAFGKYFGIKVYETGKGSGSTQISLAEVQIFGNEEIYTMTSGIHYSESEYSSLGLSMLAGKSAFRIRNNGIATPTLLSKTKSMTDGKFGEFMVISDYRDDGAFDIIYTIDKETPYTIEKFFLAGISVPQNWKERYYTAKYEVYASIELDELFAAESKVYDYDFERDGLSRWQYVNFDKEVNACYIAIRIIDATAYENEQLGVRIEEFGLYGKEAVIDYQPTNLSSYLPVSAYLTDSKGVTTEVNEQDFTVKENIYISDSDETTIADFTTDDKKLDLVFNLCNDVEISKIKVLAESKKLSYKVYAASNIGQVWAEDSLIGTYNGSDTPFEVAANEKLLNARYIRVSFAATNGNKVTVKDVQVIGLENQLLKHKAISRTLESTHVSLFARDLKTNACTYDVFKEGGMLFDSDYFGAAMTYVGVLGESSANILVNLGGLKNIDEINVYFTRYMTRHQPLELKLYVSNTYEGAMDFNAKPLTTFTGLPKEGKYSVSFKPTLARYVRVEVTKNNYNPATGEGDFINKENMTLAFSEIEIFGTKVVGMQPDFEKDNLMTFTDPETKISWEIVRLDESDIITSVFSSRLVKYKASNWQKTSLNKSPYYKVVGDDVYGVEFFDFFGNKVENIEGRQVRVKFPATAEMVESGLAVGDATNPKVIELIENYAEEGYVYSTFAYTVDSKVALLASTNGEDEYWSTIGELENFSSDDGEDNNDSSDDFDFDFDLEDGSDFLGDEDLNEGITDKLKITKQVTTTVPSIWLFIVDGLLVLLLLGAIATIIVIGVKRKKAKL